MTVEQSRSALALVLMAGVGVALGVGFALLTRPGSHHPARTPAPAARESSSPSVPRAPRSPEDLPRTATLPRFVNGATRDGQPEADPRAPGYDPTAFAGVTPLYQLFQKEPRNERWAKPVEVYLGDKLARELPSIFPGVAVERVECRTAICQIDLARTGTETINKLQLQQTLAVLYSPGAGGYGAGDLSFMVAYRGDTTWLRDVPRDDPQALFSAIEARRTKLVARLRERRAAGNVASFPLVDLDKVPPP